LAAEVRRLNDILAQNQQSFCSLYQSLLQKKKRIEELEKLLVSERKESDNREHLLTDKLAQTMFELETMKV
jgi:hypothetical protein